MQTSFPKLHRSRWLASAGLGSALAVLLLSASTPRLAAQSAPQSYNFNNQSDAGWSHLDYGIPPDPNFYYPPNTYSFVTNTAGPAGNYGYRIQIPIYTNDPLYHFLPLGGSFLTGMTYGNQNDSTGGRFSVASDLIAWNTVWNEMEVGVAWSGNIPNLQTPSAYFAGWGPGEKTLGMGVVVNGIAQFGLIALVAPGTTVLQTNHQYRIVASTYDGSTWLATIYDVAQPNSPWQSAISVDTSIATTLGNGGGGTVGLMGAVLHPMVPPDYPTQGADATWDNFSVGAIPFVDPSGSTPANMPATVTDLYPPPAGKVTEYYPTIGVGFLNRDTGVNSGNPNWVKLYLDGVQIPNNQLTIDPSFVYKPHNNEDTGYPGPQAPYPTSFPGATITYSNTSLLARGWHTNTVVFEDDQTINGTNVLHTTTWSWNLAYPTPFAANGSLSVKGFDARLVMSYNLDSPLYANIGQPANKNMDNSVAAAATLLTIPCPYLVNFAATNKVDLVNFNRNNETINGNPVSNFPGMCLPAADPAYVNSYAVEVLAYLQLAAGTNAFYVDSDDAVAVYTGDNLTDSSTVLMSNNGVAHQAFNWVVLQAGLYPVRIIMEEGAGGAYLVLSSVNPDNSKTLVNAVGGVNAYYPLACLSSASVKGPFTVDAAANAGNVLTTASSLCESGTGPISNLTVTGGTITVPLSSTPKFYRLDGPRKTKFTKTTKSGTNLLIEYQAY